MKKLFKKLSKKETAASVQALSKAQLEKVIGGADTSTTTTSEIFSENNKGTHESTKSTISVIR